jgi:hypothetical protein
MKNARYVLMCVLVAVCGLGALIGRAHAAPEDAVAARNRDATQVASAWFTSLMQGETAVTTSLSAVPFSFDGKLEVKTLPELKKLYDKIVADKGKRDLKLTATKIKSSEPELVVVVLMIEDEGIAVSVKPGEAFRVVGFSD